MLNEQFPKSSLFLGGARSGKSELAEKLVKTSGFTMIYLATAEVFEGEMEARVDSHKKRRGSDWLLIEEILAIADIIKALKPDEIVLVDCLTLWLSNLLHVGQSPDTAQSELIQALGDSAGHVVFVSNEVGMGIVPDNQISRAFRDAQGALNQAIAQAVDLVVFSAAGLPLVLKGQLPETEHER